MASIPVQSCSKMTGEHIRNKKNHGAIDNKHWDIKNEFGWLCKALQTLV